jgi:hypothetical protein
MWYVIPFLTHLHNYVTKQNGAQKVLQVMNILLCTPAYTLLYVPYINTTVQTQGGYTSAFSDYGVQQSDTRRTQESCLPCKVYSYISVIT